MRIAGYEVQDELGSGSQGTVYRVREPSTGVVRALKVLAGSLDPESVLRFRREAETLARLNGRGVVAVHSTGVEGGRLYYVLDLMPGGSLGQRLASRGRLDWREAAGIAAKLARTLELAGGLGLVHRDLKPANVLFDDSGQPRIADFGCVRDLGASALTETGTALGTPDYMAPEQLDREASDLLEAVDLTPAKGTEATLSLELKVRVAIEAHEYDRARADLEEPHDGADEPERALVDRLRARATRAAGEADPERARASWDALASTIDGYRLGPRRP